MDWKKIVANVLTAAATGYVSTGTWEGAIGFTLANLAALFQAPPHRQQGETAT